MRYLWIFAVIALSFSVEKSFGTFPSSLHKCTYGDLACVTESMQYVISNYAKSGFKELNLRPFDPLHIKSLKLERNPKSPVNIELAFQDVDLLGLGSAKVRRLKSFNRNLTETGLVEIISPKIVLKGSYSIDGSVLILPIVGKGNSEIMLENVVFVMKTKNHPVQKDGKTYLVFDGMKLEIKPKRVHFKLENLFNGNKELGDNINKFMNENWSEIFTELQPAIAEAFALIIKQLISSVFEKYPYEEFFDSA